MHIRKRLFTEKLVRYRLPREEVMAFGLPQLAQPHQCSLWGSGLAQRLQPLMQYFEVSIHDVGQPSALV